MRRRWASSRRGGGDHVGHVNVTPMIDVVMCLIVFYLIVGRLAGDSGRVSLPSTRAGEKAAVPRVVVSLSPGADGNTVARVGEREVPMPDVAAAIRDAAGDPTNVEIGVRADRRLAWGQVRPIVDACRSVGVKSIKLITERAGGGGGGGGGGGS